MKNLTASEYREYIREQFNEEVDMTDDELQHDIDDFFDEFSSKKYELQHSDEVEATRRFLRRVILLIGATDFCGNN